MIESLRNAKPLTKIGIGLYGADTALVLRVVTSHLGRTGKEIGIGVAVGLALVVDPLFLLYLRGKITNPGDPGDRSD